MSVEKLLEALSTVQEPDLGKDLVTLNMVKDLLTEGNKVSFTVTLTTPACPLKDRIKNDCVRAIHTVCPEAVVLVNFALSLAADGAKVGLMDADIYGPSLPIMFGVRGERPMMKNVNGKGMILPLEKYGIRLMSIGLLIDEKNAVVWRGPMVSSAITQFISEVYWDELDYLVIDMPPGTGDIHLTLMQ